MVPIESRLHYFSASRVNEKFDLFYSFVFGDLNNVDSHEDYGEVIDLIRSISNNSKNEFANQYANYKDRELKASLPFVKDDVLCFLFLIGVLKFDVPNDWIGNVINTRRPTSEEAIEIKESFKDVISGRFDRNGLTTAFAVVLENINRKPLVSNEVKIKYYEWFVNKKVSFSQSPFMNAILYRAFDIVLLEFNEDSKGQIERLVEFERIFIKRVGLFSKIIYFLVIVLLFILLFDLLANEEWKEWIGNFDTVAGIIGSSLATYLTGNRFGLIFKKFVFFIFGYREVSKMS